MKTAKKIIGILFGILFIATTGLQIAKKAPINITVMQYATIAELGICLMCLLPVYKAKNVFNNAALSKKTIIATVFIIVSVPLTILFGMYFLDNKKYYFISLLIILEVLIPFFARFENRKPSAREIIVISVICAIAVSGRMAFSMLPQFKPVIAVVIIAGVCFGSETGFLVGTVTGFVSNFFFGQGPWTPWQMLGFALPGLLAGIIFRQGFVKPTKQALCIYGALATVILFGGITNPCSVLLYNDQPTLEMFVSAFVMGLPFDLLHAFSTVLFMWFIGEPMIDKLQRIKIKYGLIQK